MQVGVAPDGARQLREGWRDRAVTIELDAEHAGRLWAITRRFLGQARREEYAGRTTALQLHPSAEVAAFGALAVQWGRPGAAGATIRRVSWDPQIGEAKVWDAADRLVGLPLPR